MCAPVVLPGTRNVTLPGTVPTLLVVGDAGLIVIAAPSQVADSDDVPAKPVPVIVTDEPALPVLEERLIAGVTVYVASA